MNPEQLLSPEGSCVSNSDRGRQGDDSSVQSRCRYKGVVAQQNGHWGAQIYANQRRVWLGTFKTEMDAAMAYDSAAVRLRSSDSFRNIDSSHQAALLETEFQSQFSMDDVLNMIKDGSYQRSLAEFKRMRHHQTQPRFGRYGGYSNAGEQAVCTMLFQKEVTPSDVGKLNRLVIPKKFALVFLPQLKAIMEGSKASLKEEDMETEISFFDRQMKCWRFRYCYWKSSQSFVFTRGWNKFVKAQNLKAKDSVVFYRCQIKGQGRDFFRIEVRLSQATTSVAEVDRSQVGHEEHFMCPQTRLEIHLPTQNSGDFTQRQVGQEEAARIHLLTPKHDARIHPLPPKHGDFTQCQVTNSGDFTQPQVGQEEAARIHQLTPKHDARIHPLPPKHGEFTQCQVTRPAVWRDAHPCLSQKLRNFTQHQVSQEEAEENATLDIMEGNVTTDILLKRGANLFLHQIDPKEADGNRQKKAKGNGKGRRKGIRLFGVDIPC